MPPSVQGTQESQLEDFVTTGNGDPRNRGTLPRATLVVSGFATHAVRLWPFETWGRAIVISDLCRDPVNFHPVLLFSASFSSVVASCCSPILNWGGGAGGQGRKTLTADKTSHLVFLLCSVNHLPAGFLWPIISRIFFFSCFRGALTLRRLAGSSCLSQSLKLATVLKTFSLYAFAISACLIVHSIKFWLWLFSC